MERTSRSHFNESFLFEMPPRLANPDAYAVLVGNIQERIKFGMKPIPLDHNLFKMGRNVLVYWYQHADVITLATEITVETYSLIVNLTGKNPSYQSQPPYASDLYCAILNDSDRSLVFSSDTHLSDQGLVIWQRLLAQGHNISVYNRNRPGSSFQVLLTAQDLENFVGNTSDFQQWVFVLSEDFHKSQMLAETVSCFGTRRGRETAGMPLTDLSPEK